MSEPGRRLLDAARYGGIEVGGSGSKAGGEGARSFFSHGLSVQTAEGLAEYAHGRIRQELGLGEEQGKRYSWGYPSCPDLSRHVLVDRLLGAGAIGVRVTAGHQFEPEQTTAALVVTHPAARYFALALTGGDKGEGG